MSEETDAPQGGAEDVVASEAVETPSEATTEQPTATETADQPDTGDEPEPKRVPWFQKRIDEVTAQKYEAQRQADYWRGLAEGRTQPQSQSQPAEKPLPTLADYNYDEGAYAKALIDLAREETEKSFESKLTEREKQAAESTKTQTAMGKLVEGGSKYPDFSAAVSDLPLTEAVRDFVLDDPNAADVLYELGKDTAAARRFESLPPHLQALELGRRSASGPKPQTKTIAPPPPATVGGASAGATKAPEQMTYDEYREWRDKGGGR